MKKFLLLVMLSASMTNCNEYVLGIKNTTNSIVINGKTDKLEWKGVTYTLTEKKVSIGVQKTDTFLNILLRSFNEDHLRMLHMGGCKIILQGINSQAFEISSDIPEPKTKENRENHEQYPHKGVHGVFNEFDSRKEIKFPPITFHCRVTTSDGEIEFERDSTLLTQVGVAVESGFNERIFTLEMRIPLTSDLVPITERDVVDGIEMYVLLPGHEVAMQEAGKGGEDDMQGRTPPEGGMGSGPMGGSMEQRPHGATQDEHGTTHGRPNQSIEPIDEVFILKM